MLYSILEDCWLQLSHDLRQSLVESISRRRRFQTVIDVNGKPAKYLVVIDYPNSS